MKKIFAIAMMICLLVSTFSINAFATNETTDKPAPGVVVRVSALKKDGTPTAIENGDFKSFEEGWESAIGIALKKTEMEKYSRIVVDFYGDWNANDDGEFGDSDGKGFRFSTIHVPEGVRITLNLNGHKIDRALKKWEYDGEVMYIDEDADVTINDGTISGGWSCNGAGGIHLVDNVTLELNNVHVVKNNVEDDDGSAIAAYNNSTVIMNGGSLSNNRMYYPNSAYATRPYGTLYLSDSKAVLTDVEIANNDAAGLQWAEGLVMYLDNSKATMTNCVIKNNGWLPSGNDPSVVNTYVPSSLFYLDDSASSLKVAGCKFENNGDETQDLTSTPDRHYDIFKIEDGRLVVTDSSFENNHLNHIITAYYGTFEVENCSFINNRARLFYYIVESGRFSKCTFSGNNLKGESGVYLKYIYWSNGVKFSDCEFDNNPIVDEKFNKSEILNTSDSNGTGSIFGEGSLTMIIAIVALVASAVSICMTIVYNKKRSASEKNDKSSEKEE